MTEKQVLPWVAIAINEMMEDRYRDIVVKSALNHYYHLPKKLNKFVTGILKQATDNKKVKEFKGYRPFPEAPMEKVREFVSAEFKNSNAIATIIICMWADANQQLIQNLKGSAQNAGFIFSDNWDWEKARIGFKSFEDISEFHQYVLSLIADREKSEQDNYILAALWLSGSLADQIETKPKASIDPPDGKTSTPPDLITVTTPVKPIPAFLDLTKFDNSSIESLAILWDKQYDQINNFIEQVKTKAEDIKLAASEANLSMVNAHFRDLETVVLEWGNHQENIFCLADYLFERLLREVKSRSDIDTFYPGINSENLTSEKETGALKNIVSLTIKAIIAYDESKSSSLTQLERLFLQVGTQKQRLSLWQSENPDLEKYLEQFDSHELTLSHIQHQINDMEKVIGDANEKIAKLRENSVKQITDTAKNIAELRNTINEIQIEGFSITQLVSLDAKDLNDEQILSLEFAIQSTFNNLILTTVTGDSQKLATALTDTWSEENYIDLLICLSREKKDLEAALVELSASSLYPSNTLLLLNKDVAKNLFSGILEICNDSSAPEFLNQLAYLFFLSWTSDDLVIRTEKCIIALAAHIIGSTELPEGFLWQIETEWPIESMTSWATLWQSVLLGENVEIFTDQKETDLESKLENKRKEAEFHFLKDGGHYIRLSSVKSNRHRALMTDSIMPEFQEILNKLMGMESESEGTKSEYQEFKLGKLSNLLQETSDNLREKLLIAKYEKRAFEDGIDDSHQPYHRKICLKIMSELADAILEFGKCLLERETLRETRRNGINYQDLYTELNQLSNKSPLSTLALDQISKHSPTNKNVRDEETIQEKGITSIIKKVLCEPLYIQRIPNVIGAFVNNKFSWSLLLNSLLTDIAIPHNDIDSAVSVLLDFGAPNQAILVIDRLSLDVQKKVEASRVEQQKKSLELENELISLGCDIEWSVSDRNIGRWGYLFTKFRQIENDARKKSEEQHKELENQTLVFREKIFKLDTELFRAKSEIPKNIYRQIDQGLVTARKASEVEGLYPALSEYLNELEYRISHKAFIENEIENATLSLEKLLTGEEGNQEVALDVDNLYNLFSDGNLSEVGLENGVLQESQINTRADVLGHWLNVKRIHNILSERMNQTDIDRIKDLFSFFGQMTAMKGTRGTDDRYMSYEKPIVHEYWELRYPQTASLDKQCVLIALPGNPPSAEDLQHLDNFLEDERFLDFHFVFLFIPGCTEKIAKRFAEKYATQGLVVINDTVITQMVLAERQNNMTPLGKLRPIMLNSTGANDIIFTVNQSVSDRTDIFVGRDQLIGRISSSSDNYAIYGGRRIGKSSLLKAIEQKLKNRNVRVISYSLEAEQDYSDPSIAKKIASKLGLDEYMQRYEDLKQALDAYLSEHPNESLVLIIDEIDLYIAVNKDRHILMETMRTTSETFGNRFRVIIAGFMGLYDCLQGRGPYSTASDPWGRTLNNIGPLENLKSSDAEKIARVGFQSILGWQFEHRSIPQQIVEKTGGHPAFVQYFCYKLQERVRQRGDQKITIKDIEAVFADQDPEKSFIAYVRKTLKMNLEDPVSRYLILWLALDSRETKSFFGLDQINEIANSGKIPIPNWMIERSLELLTVNSVVEKRTAKLYTFTVPDYPLMLNQLNEGSHFDELTRELEDYLMRHTNE